MPFLAALRRFFARRGRSTDLHSDNATNFVGANEEIDKFQNLFRSEENVSKLINTLADGQITWHFIPQRSPHFGGLWKAAVKSLKVQMSNA